MTWKDIYTKEIYKDIYTTIYTYTETPTSTIQHKVGQMDNVQVSPQQRHHWSENKGVYIMHQEAMLPTDTVNVCLCLKLIKCELKKG